jgi:hypothetical protein
MNASSWMNDTTALHALPLRQICIPTTHDSGTYELRNPMVGAPGLPAPLVALYNELPSIAKKFAGIRYERIGEVLAAATLAAEAGIFTAVKGLATANRSSIGEQLANGIRGLDLRIAKSDGAFYTYHGLNGTPLDTVLSEIASFLQQSSGEIVYVTFGHYEGFRAGTSAEDTLLQQIQQSLDTWAYAPQTSGGSITNDVWNQTWQEIVTLGGTAPQSSRVILVNGESSTPSGIYWAQPYSPPDSTNVSMAIYGAYTNTTSVETMLNGDATLAGQIANFCAAQGAGLPFALYMTLTPQGSDYTKVIVHEIAQALDALGEQLQGEHGGIMAILGEILEVISSRLEIADPAPAWRTLYTLSQQIDGQLDALVEQYFAPAPGQPNGVSMIYLDWYGSTDVVDLAVGLSTGQITRTGPSPCSG